MNPRLGNDYWVDQTDLAPHACEASSLTAIISAAQGESNERIEKS